MEEYRFVILGGGILGTAVAYLAAGMHLRPLVLRLPDEGCPRADSLRNQGWLQSGLFYSRAEFEGDGYEVVARDSYFAGRQLLKECKLAARPSAECAVARVANETQAKGLEEKNRTLRLPESGFHRLARGEAQDRLGEWYEAGSIYYATPDQAFDEAGVLHYLRDGASRQGATFLQLKAPAQLRRERRDLHIVADGRDFVSPYTVIAAGAGSGLLVEQAGLKFPGHLMQTPLLVLRGQLHTRASILVDGGRGLSLVRHGLEGQSECAVVVGLTDTAQRVQFRLPDKRNVKDQEGKFRARLPPWLPGEGRFTAGYEVVPDKSRGPSKGKARGENGMSPTTKYELFTVKGQGFLFASPGRATAVLDRARAVMKVVVEELARRTQSCTLSGAGRSWTEPVAMHFSDVYDFNDAN